MTSWEVTCPKCGETMLWIPVRTPKPVWVVCVHREMTSLDYGMQLYVTTDGKQGWAEKFQYDGPDLRTRPCGARFAVTATNRPRCKPKKRKRRSK